MLAPMISPIIHTVILYTYESLSVFNKLCNMYGLGLLTLLLDSPLVESPDAWSHMAYMIVILLSLSTPYILKSSLEVCTVVNTCG